AVFQSGRKIFGGTFEELAHASRGLNGIGSGELINDEQRCGDAVLSSEARVTLAGEFGARDVLHPEDGSIRVGSHDHVCELGRLRETAFDVDRVLKLSA